MATSRHLGRIIVLQTLYEHSFYGDQATDNNSLEQIVTRHINREKRTQIDKQFVLDLARGVIEKTDELNDIIKPIASQRPLADIPLIDHQILKIGIYELHYQPDVPPKAVINEAVESAKQFGSENSSKFINGVLGTVYRQLTGTDKISAEVDAKPLKKADSKLGRPAVSKT